MVGKWDTSVLIGSLKEYEDTLKELKAVKENIMSFKGKLKDKNEFKKFLKEEERYFILSNKLGLYVFLEKSTNLKNVDILVKEKQLLDLSEQDSKDYAFIDIEEKAFSSKYIKELINDKSLSAYKRGLLKLEEEKKHILSYKEEVLLSGAAFLDMYEDVFDSLTIAEMKFEPVVLKSGKKFVVSENTISLIQNLKDKEDRKKCMLSLFNGYKQHNLSLATSYLASVKSENFFAKSRNYKSTFERALKGSEVTEKVYTNLIEGVHGALPLFYKFTRALKDYNGGSLAITDVKAHVFRLPNKKYTYEKSLELVYNAVSVLGEDYVWGLKSIVENNRVDVYPAANKQSGAFQTSDQNGNIFVLLNHINDFNSVETMAHEFGHAMHSYYSDKAQPYNLRMYETFVAEVASTVNELLLFEYMAKNSKTKKEKLAYIEMMIQMVQSTVFRQTMFAEFEYWVHQNVNEGKPLTFKDLNEKYLSLVKLYFGKSVKVYPEYQYEWSRIPHFYRSFYVYKYATGMLSSMLIVKKLKEDSGFVSTYKKFLSSGASADPVALLRGVGVDLEQPETIAEAFSLYKEWIEEFKRG